MCSETYFFFIITCYPVIAYALSSSPGFCVVEYVITKQAKWDVLHCHKTQRGKWLEEKDINAGQNAGLGVEKTSMSPR